MKRVKQMQQSFLSEKIGYFLARDACLAANSNYEKDRAAELKARSNLIGRYSVHVKRGYDLFDLAQKAIDNAEKSGKDIISGSLWAADELTHAKGRFNRIWYAPRGGAYFVLAIYPKLERCYWSLYSLACGIAIAQIIREWGCDAGVRWINDVLLHGKKIAGILTKSYKAQLSQQTYILLGAGINVNIDSFPDHLPEAGSLLCETGKKWPVWDLASHIIARLGWLIALAEQWEAEQMDSLNASPYNPIIYAWERCNITLKRQISYGYNIDQEVEFTGLAHSIEQDGSLNIVLESGEMININSGEIRFL